jgi:hypothetical protein
MDDHTARPSPFARRGVVDGVRIAVIDDHTAAAWREIDRDLPRHIAGAVDSPECPAAG